MQRKAAPAQFAAARGSIASLRLLLPRGLVWLPALAAVGGLCAGAPAIANAQEADADKAPERLETKNIFGFTSGTDIGPERDREIELETDLAFIRRGGSYNVGGQKATLEYNPFAWLEVDTGVRASFNQIKGVEGFEDRSGANFGGIESKFSFVMIHRTPATPVGLTVSVEPEWSRVGDEGRVGSGFSVETRLILDTELVPETLYASFNAIYAPESVAAEQISVWARSNTFGFACALAYRLDPSLAPGLKQAVLGAELEYYRSSHGFGLKAFNGDALYFGPTFYFHFNDTLFLAGAISTQIAGGASGDSRPLDLVHFSRNKAEVTIGIEF